MLLLQGCALQNPMSLQMRILRPELQPLNPGDETFTLEVPKAGVTGDTVSTGAFTAAWTAGIGVYTTRIPRFCLDEAPFQPRVLQGYVISKSC